MNPTPHERRNYKLDPGTIGGSVAAKILCEKLNQKENKHAARGLLARLHKYNRLLNEISKIQDRAAKLSLFDLVHKEHCTNYFLSPNYGENEKAGLASFTLNVMDMTYRKHRNGK